MKMLVRLAEFGLAALFLYLGVSKLLAPGAPTIARTVMAIAELGVGALLMIRASEWIATPAVITVAVTEVVLFSRPPLAAVACIGAHALTSWARSKVGAHGIQYEDEPRPFEPYSPFGSVQRERERRAAPFAERSDANGHGDDRGGDELARPDDPR